MGNEYSHVPLANLTELQVFELVNGVGPAFASFAQVMKNNNIDGNVLCELSPDADIDKHPRDLGLENGAHRLILVAKL